MKKLFKVDIEPLQIERNGSKVSLYLLAENIHPPRFPGALPSFEQIWIASISYSGEVSSRDRRVIRERVRTAFQDAGLEFHLVTKAKSRSTQHWPPDVQYVPAYLNPETLITGNFRFPHDPFAPQKLGMLQADITARLSILAL